MKNIKRLPIIMLAAAMVFVCSSPLTVLAEDSNPPPEGYSSWDDYFNGLLNPSGVDVEVPPLEQMNLVGENNNFQFYYHEGGADAYVVDKRNNKLWSSAIHPDYMDTESLLANAKTTLLDVGIADKDGAIKYYSLTDSGKESDFVVTAEYQKNQVTLNVEVKDTGVSFNLKMWVDEEGFNYSIPIESLKEIGQGRLIAINALPMFGAASNKEDGYIFYPDGSGALIDIEKYDLPQSKEYRLPLYGTSEQSIEDLQDQNEQDIKNLMLPVFGIKHTAGSLLAAVTEGAENGTLILYMGETYRAYFRFDYRTYATVEYNYTGNVFDNKTVSELVPNRIDKTHTVKYFLLDKSEGSYSDMAVKYRQYLIATDVLSHRVDDTVVPLSIDFFMGVQESGFFLKSITALTTFSQSQSILGDLRSEGVKAIQTTLTGWSKGGYDTMPTALTAESKLGGNSALRTLADYCQDNDLSLSVGMNFLYGNKISGSFNVKKEALRNWLGKLITDKTGDLFLLNPVRGLDSRVDDALNKLDDNIQLNLQAVGSLVIPDYKRSDPTCRQQVVATYDEILEAVAERKESVVVSGGNGYVLPYATRLYDIPDNDSRYYQNSRSVPFYQMVVHGYVEYSSLAGNMSYSVDYQKLKWIESGSIPHFLITEQNPVLLKDTSYNKIFSSQYTVWKDTMIAVYEEFNTRLSGVWNQTIDRHEWLSDTVVRLTYGDGSQTYINYGSEAATLEGQSIPHMDYLVVQQQGG